MNKKVIIISLLGIVMFILGIIMNFIFSNSNNNNNNNDDSSKSPSYITPTKIQKEHCLEDICISSMKITIKGDNSYITGIITNKSDLDILNGSIDFNFELTDGRNIIQTYQYSLLSSKVENNFEMIIPTKNIQIAADYKIQKTIDE